MINFTFQLYYWKIALFQSFNAAQGILCVLYILDSEHPTYLLLMQIMAAFLITIEVTQIVVQQWDYFEDAFNIIESCGNIGIFIIDIDIIKPYKEIVVGLILYKALQTLKIISQLRTLIQMILECMYRMIPFLTIVILYVVTFSVINISVSVSDESLKFLSKSQVKMETEQRHIEHFG